MLKRSGGFAVLVGVSLFLVGVLAQAYPRHLGVAFRPVKQGSFAGPKFKAPGEVLRSEVYTVKSWFDGVELVLNEVEGNALGEPIVFYPGTIMTPQAYEEIIVAAHALGFKPYIAQARRTGHVNLQSGRGQDNGLQEKLYHDAPALMEAVAILNPGRVVHLFGHSLGGMMGIANGANKNLWNRLGGQFGRIQSFAGPHNLSYLPKWVKRGANILHPLVWAISKLPDFHTVSPVQTFYKYVDHQREGKLLQRKYAGMLDQLAARLGSTFLAAVFLDADHVTDVKLKEFLVDGMGLVSTQLLLDYGRATKTKFFMGRPGSAYEGLNLVPVFAVRPDIWTRHYALSKDYLADLRAFTDELPWMRRTQRSDLWVLNDVKHVGPMVENRRGNFASVLSSFYAKSDAELASERFQSVRFNLDAAKNCEMILSPLGPTEQI